MNPSSELATTHLSSEDDAEQDKSFEWYLQDANEGNASSQYHVGVLYHRGEFTLQDYSKGFQWYLKAAENGHVEAQYQVGQGFEYFYKDSSKAFEWFLKAAESGHSLAQARVGFHYAKVKSNGMDLSDVEKKLTKAIYWCTKSFNGNGFTFFENSIFYH